MGRKQVTEITRLLERWHSGDRAALDALLPVVYKSLEQLAHFQMRKERPDHTLQTAALVNEANLRRVGVNAPNWDRRSHPWGLPATVDDSRSFSATSKLPRFECLQPSVGFLARQRRHD